MKPSEYGGSDTDKTLGIQPAPHVPTADEQLRIIYHSDPGLADEQPIPGLLTSE
jgi:hypothetical protein